MVATPARPKAQLAAKPEIVWEKLPEDFVLPDDPVDNINQPALAAALTDSLFLAGYLSETAATTTNYGICAKVDGKTVVKAPDWSWIPAIAVPKTEVERSYTPVLEGDLPLVVMDSSQRQRAPSTLLSRLIHLGSGFTTSAFSRFLTTLFFILKPAK